MNKILTKMTDKTRIVLIACGSYNPITNMHLRMFELARDYLQKSGTSEVIQGLVSPASDAYPKSSLIPSQHRIEMVRLATKSSNWIELDTWEAEQTEWIRTANVLKHHHEELTKKHGNISLMLLCGADLLESFSVPGLWANEHIVDIVSNYGLACINRTGSNAEKFIYETDVLYAHKHMIHLITDWIPNEISSTKIRRAVSRNESVKYVIDDQVIEYIQQNGLYRLKN